MDVVVVSTPLFALVLLGYLGTRYGLLPLESIKGLNSYVLYFAITAMLFQLSSRTSPYELFNPWIIGLWAVFSWIVLALGTYPGLRSGLNWRDAAFGGLSGTTPNMGFMGIPLIAAVLGPQYLGTIMPIMIVDVVIIQSTVIALTQRKNGGAGSPIARVLVTVRGVLANPMLWAILLGALWGASGWAMPGPVDTTFDLLADSATPVALFTIGGVLAREQVTAAGVRSTATKVYISLLTFLKLLVLPALMWLVVYGAIQAGVPLTSNQHLVLVLIAALPTAANTSILAERFGANNAIVASVILTSTATGFLTFNAIAALLL